MDEYIILKNECMEVALCTLGASIFNIKYDDVDMTLTPRDKKNYSLTHFYHGKTIGRLCGRILDNNQIILHGGNEGLSTRIFDYRKHDNCVEFSYKSKDGESNCPGSMNIKVIYQLDGSSLKVSYIAIVDKPCLVSLTNHSYFCLGEKRVNNLYLKMKSNKYIVVDKNLLPVKMDNVPSKWDFSEYKSLNETGDIDNFFLVQDKKISLKSNKYQLDIISDFEGTQIYTDNFIDNVLTLLTDDLTHRGVAIEPQDNQLDRKVLKLGEEYSKFITYTFKKL